MALPYIWCGAKTPPIRPRGLRAVVGPFFLVLLLGLTLGAPAVWSADNTIAGAPAAKSGSPGKFSEAAISALPASVRNVVEANPLASLTVAVLTLMLLAVWVKLMFKKRQRNARPANGTSKRTSTGQEENLSGRYRALFENANDFILGTALDGQLLYVNTAWQRSLDLDEQEARAFSIFQTIHPDSLDKFKSGFQRAVAGVKVKNLEVTFVSKYGKRIIVEGSLHCELVDDEPISVQGIFRDVTERVRSKSALKQSEDRFTRVFAASPIAIGICTLDGGRLQDVNESFLKMLGYERHEVIGGTDAGLRLWANPEDRAHIVQKAKDGKPVRDAQCKLRSKKGEIREALISAELIELSTGRELLQSVELIPEQCLLLIIHDNTERLSLEAQLRQAQKMEGFGQMAAGVAHDFNNILTVIQGHAARLRNVEGIPPRIGESVEHVSVAADRAANLTRQLLTFCRKQAILRTVFDLNSTVTHVGEMLERILGEDIALDLNLGTGLPLIHADSGMIEQIIVNLACNSRDAMPKGGSLLIATSAVEFTPAQLLQQPKAKIGRHICLTVTDTGSGMSSETLRRIFEPFFTTKDVGKGTGLGLATVYGIVDQHQGWLEVTSKLGEGTTFKIYLPATNKACTQPAQQTVQTGVQRGSETILLVEDEEELRELARLVLEDHGYTVLQAGSGVQALKVWEQHKDKTDMLLTDMVMPEGMTGRDLAERIQAERPTIKVLYSSGYSPDVVGGTFKLPENARFLAKPYRPPALAQAVRECLDATQPAVAGSGKTSPAA